MKSGKRRAGEEGKRKQVTDFEEAVCCPSAIVQRTAKRKNEWGAPGVTGTHEKSNSHFDPAQTGSGTAHHVKATVD